MKTKIVRNRGRTVTRPRALVRPFAMVGVLDRTTDRQPATRRQSHTRMWRIRFPMLFLAMILHANLIWALPKGDVISYRDFTLPNHIEPFFIEISTYSPVHAPWPRNLSKGSFTTEYIDQADLDRVNRRAINQLKNTVPTVVGQSVLLGNAAGGKIRLVLDEESDDIWTEGEKAEMKEENASDTHAAGDSIELKIRPVQESHPLEQNRQVQNSTHDDLLEEINLRNDDL